MDPPLPNINYVNFGLWKKYLESSLLTASFLVHFVNDVRTNKSTDSLTADGKLEICRLKN